MAVTPLAALAGGALVGLSASALLALNGQVAGVSGIVGGILRPRKGEVAWRLAFVAGLLAGGLLLAWRLPQAVAPRAAAVPGALVVVAGLLVGFGTQLGSGCTSGHGVCGVSRWSVRSLAAVATFMTTGALATFFVQHVLPRLR
jgi:uncharacterized membrane protein YedE/YeeE